MRLNNEELAAVMLSLGLSMQVGRQQEFFLAVVTLGQIPENETYRDARSAKANLAPKGLERTEMCWRH